MDVAAFSGDSFDPKDWINKALRASDQSQPKEEAAASLVMKLQLMIAKLNSALEDQCNAVVQSIPRVIRDAGQLESEAQLLSAKLSAVRAEMEEVEAETKENMSSLVRMDTVKERLTATTRALQEADNWTSLDNQVEDAFDNNDHEAVAEKIVGMQQSLRLLHHVADYQERVAHLETHKNRLEATLSPLLITAFTNKDTEKALRLVKMFRTIERDKQQLSKYYHKCVRASLLQKWSEIVSDNEGETCDKILDLWFTLLARELGEDKTWVETVFTDQDSASLICHLASDVMSSLQPSPQFVIEAGVKLSQDVLGLLISLRQRVDKFLNVIEQIVSGAEDYKLRELGKAVYKPFVNQVNKYEELEVKSMSAEVSSWIVEKKDSIDELHSLGNCVAKFATMAETAAGRCVNLTRGSGFPGLVSALARVLDSHLDRYRKLIRRLEKKKVIVDDDWSVLQNCLSANQCTGELQMMIEKLEITLSSMFLEACRGYLGQDSSEAPLQQHHIFLLDSDAIVSLNELYSSISSSSSMSTMLHKSLSLLSSVCSDLQKTTFTVMFHPVSTQLELVPGLDTWSARTSGHSSVDTADMPEFSLSPSEYITCIGEYLMTLPQHLEPYMSQDSLALITALKQAVFPGSSEADTAGIQSPADFLLGCISSSLCSTYISYISSIPALNTGSAKQLAVDISYLGDILDDLGHPVSGDLSSLGCLLRLAEDKWNQESGGHNSKIVATVRKLRKIN